MSENKNRMSTTELVDIVTSFCEMYSGINFYPYQEQFARRIIRSVLTNDGNEISALFSRQCIPEGELIHTREGGLVKIEDHPDSWVTNESAEVLQISIKGGYTLKCTANHPVMTDKGWLQAGLLKAGDKVEVLLKWDKFDDSFKPKIVDHTNFKFYTDYYLNTQMKKGSFLDYNIIPVSSVGEDGEELGLSVVESISKLEGTYRVYDVTYPGKGWFICNGVKVHNSGKSETVSVVCGGLMVILPKLANTPMFLDDPRLTMFKNGFTAGVFAPSQRQAQTTYGKIRSKVEGQRGLEIISDPEFNLKFTTSNGTTVGLSNGSFVTAISASDGSNIEGESFMLLLMEECQDISDFKILKSLHPMGAAYNASVVKIGTPSTRKGNFYNVIQRNKKEFEEGDIRIRNHFEYDYKVVSKYNDKYRKYVEQEKKRLGEKSLTGDRLVTVKIDGVVQLLPLEDLYSLYDKDGSNSKYLYPQNLEALSAKSGSILTDILDLKDYHLTDNQKPVIQALKSVDITKKGYRDKVSEITGIRKTKVEGIINTVRALLKAGSYYDLEPVWSPVTKIIRHECLEPIVKVSNGQGETVITEHHSLMAVQKSGLVEVTPKEASDLFRIRDIPDSVCMTSINFDELLKYNDEIYNTNSFTEIVIDGDYLKLISRRDKTPYVSFPRNIDVGSDTFNSLSRICGAYCSEGYVLQRDIVSGISVTDLDWIESLQADVKLVFNYDAPIVTSSKLNKGTGTSYKTMYRLCLNRKIIGIVLRHLCGQGSRHKKVPYFLFNIEPQHQLPFLNTLIEGDGHYDRRSNGLSYGTTSLSLACGYMYLQSRQGRQTQVYYNETNKIYQLRDCVAGTNNARGELRVVNTDLSPEFVYDLEVEDTHNFVDSLGQVLVHNSDEFQMSYALAWILQRGMFIDIDEFEARNVDPNYDIVPYDKSATHVVGIDVGGASDSTVITVCEVDWTMPVVMESRTDEETGEEIVYQCYNTYVKAWHEIKDTPNFEEQYVEIMHFLSNFKIARIVIDATKESALADRINANTPYEVISYVFSSKSKSDLYKTFEREVNSGRVHVPGGEDTKQSPEYLKCLAQLQDLEKSWRGAYMVVSHPPTKDGRDDFPDSLALAIWGCMDRGEVSDIRGSDRRAFINPNAKLFKERNQYTARRRR